MTKILRFFIIAHLVNQLVSSKVRKLAWDTENQLETQDFFEHLKKWNSSYIDENDIELTADEMFQQSSKNSELILTDFSKCLGKNFGLLNCVKMFLLNRVKLVRDLLKDESLNKRNIDLLHGLLTLKYENTSNTRKSRFGTSLDDKLADQIEGLFESRSIRVNFFNGYGIEVKPKDRSDKDGFVCFTAKTFHDPDYNRESTVEERKKKGKKKKGGFNMMPMMILPQMIMMGFLPFALANLKMMVMNAFMMNTMALNSMIFMTIRNLVFGPKGGPQVKYVNYGYDKNHVSKTKKPELVLHSPAAFVKKPHREESYQELNISPHGFENAHPNLYVKRNNHFRSDQKHRFNPENKPYVDAQSSYLSNTLHLTPTLNPQYHSYNDIHLVSNKN